MEKLTEVYTLVTVRFTFACIRFRSDKYIIYSSKNRISLTVYIAIYESSLLYSWHDESIKV